MSSPPDRARLRAALQAIVGADGVLTEPDELLVYESDGLTIFRATADAVEVLRRAQSFSARERISLQVPLRASPKRPLFARCRRP